jgi:hypothetical protein
MLSPPLAEVSLSRSSSHLSFYLAADPSTATLRSTAHRSSTAYRGRDDHRILSLSLSLSRLLWVCFLFFLSLSQRPVTAWFCFDKFLLSFFVLEDACRVFDKMSEPNYAWFCGCDNFLLSFFGSQRCSTGVRQNV